MAKLWESRVSHVPFTGVCTHVTVEITLACNGDRANGTGELHEKRANELV